MCGKCMVVSQVGLQVAERVMWPQLRGRYSVVRRCGQETSRAQRRAASRREVVQDAVCEGVRGSVQGGYVRVRQPLGHCFPDDRAMLYEGGGARKDTRDGWHVTKRPPNFVGRAS